MYLVFINSSPSLSATTTGLSSGIEDFIFYMNNGSCLTILSYSLFGNAFADPFFTISSILSPLSHDVEVCSSSLATLY